MLTVDNVPKAQGEFTLLKDLNKLALRLYQTDMGDDEEEGEGESEETGTITSLSKAD